MSLSRRVFSLSLMGSLLSACVGGGGRAPVVRSSGAASFPPQSNAAFDAWLAAFRDSKGAGFSSGTQAQLMQAQFLPGVIERDRNQTEFTRTTEDYLAIATSPERMSIGSGAVRQYRGVLDEVEGRYGVPWNVVAAVWGLESMFGTRRGDVPVVSALATLAFDGRRGAFFESQLVAALKILENGDVRIGGMTGSWAGAMGHTQFIPTSYLAYAVDFRGDGRRDIWGDDPTDGLASTGAYLSKSGWQRGLPWGMEVSLPSGFDTGLAGRGKGKSAAEWNAYGVTRAGGGALPAGGSILLPAGTQGPAFLLTQNFNVILRYNNAENYALGVGHLSDRLAGAGPLRGAFPPDATGMTLADRQALQQRLTAAGYDTGGSDGVIGAKTRDAISAAQRALGMPVTGEPSLELLRRL
jgi:membrane-bound lytic murein transglycosylase B